jgi:hypothetical protein
MALEYEIELWKSFKKALQSEEDKEAFEAMMDMCRKNGMASSNACNPIIFKPMTMSIFLAQQKRMQKLDYKLNEVQWKKIYAQENNKTATVNPSGKTTRNEKQK